MFTAYVDESLFERFWDLIRKKYPKSTYGAVSSEVQDALAHWVSKHEESFDLRTNTHKPVNPSLPRTHREARQIVDYLKNKGFTLQVHINEVRKAIVNTRGSDARTVKKWMQILVREGYMKFHPTQRILEIL